MTNNDAALAAARLNASCLIRRYGMESPDQIDLEAIAFERGITVSTGYVHGAEAYLLRDRKQGIIRLRESDLSSGRARFSLGHELGHWECHAGQNQIWVCNAQNIHGYRGNPQELEANAFAAELLMPKELFLPRLAEKQLNIALLCELATEFRTTLTATAVRAIDASKDDCCVVFSQDDVVRWWRKSGTGFNFWLPRNFALDTASRAFDCVREPQRALEPRRVSSDAWNVNERSGFDVWEQSALLHEYGIVLTVLSFA